VTEIEREREKEEFNYLLELKPQFIEITDYIRNIIVIHTNLLSNWFIAGNELRFSKRKCSLYI
jgi:hypothetical protein